jgi:hypothetical protein
MQTRCTHDAMAIITRRLSHTLYAISCFNVIPGAWTARYAFAQRSAPLCLEDNAASACLIFRSASCVTGALGVPILSTTWR